MTRRGHGFTLIELLVVVAIIALLISILLPALKQARDQAKKAVCSANLRSIAQATISYTLDNRDRVPVHQGPEPDYVYVRNSSTIQALGNEWHLGELLMPYMNMDPPVRGNAGLKFRDEDLALSARNGKIFYCPQTGNANGATANFPTWGNPSTFGSFMDYAQFWGWIGPSSMRIGGKLQALTADGFYRVLDDDQNVLPGDPNNPSDQWALYELPFSAARLDHRRVPNSSSEVPMYGDYLASFNRMAPQIRTDFQAQRLLPEAGNHPWTGHTPGSSLRVQGGNFAYVDGHVEWRTLRQVRPRLLIDRAFTGGSNRPTYWW